MGNVNSILSMIKRLGYPCVISGDTEQIKKASKIIIPGVGSFDNGVININKFKSVLMQKAIVEKVPTLGICLGMQLMTKYSEEGNLEGLGWIDGSVKKIDSAQYDVRVPHMSWNTVGILKKTKIFEGLEDNSRFYFAHSYCVSLNDKNIAVAETNYGVKFISCFEKENIVGVQFHPEKSHKFGMQLLTNFIAKY